MSTPTAASADRIRAAWRAAHEPVPGAPRWARRAAYAVPLVVLPATLWRLPLVFSEEAGPGEAAYVVLLSVVSELLAFTAVGMVAGWGERFPRWVPWLRGRRVPTPVAVFPASVGAVLLTALWTWIFAAHFAGLTLRGDPIPADYPTQAGGWQAAVFYACYLPLLLWGPLLAAVTWAYWRRRRLSSPHTASARDGGGPGSVSPAP
ncbi:hypothetical protein LG943_08975 [Streptomonospora sp. S1-112]|uniref:Uncharacterized protein n=1 Tax=Streptomonospora mangrovi TaxID=2883123 RepID=A0A9X3NIS5_9ACTN|nr:hypothetical protein [Streptomonospora mangrovi]MDA0564457.1 hypothetical protein [Streptomonospora mangrovi]